MGSEPRADLDKLEADYAATLTRDDRALSDYALYQRQLQQLRGGYESEVQRRAQGAYFIGMLAGVALLGALVGPVFPMLLNAWSTEQIQWHFYNGFYFLLVSLVVGSVGAIVSVMQRMTAGNLILSPSAGRLGLGLNGAFRPLIGAIIASAIYFLLNASLLPAIAMPDANEVQKLFFFFCAVAFFAGFSERWAQDILAVGQQNLGGARGSTSRSAAQ